VTVRIELVGTAATRLLQPGPARTRLELQMALASRWSHAMAAWILEATLQPLTRRAPVEAWARSGQATGSYRGRTVVVAGGPVPDPGVRACAAAVLLGGPLELKVAAEEPVLTPAFASALAAAGPVDLTVHRFRGGTAPAAEAALFGRADRLVAFGRAPTLAAIAAQLRPGALCLGHGPRLSLGLVVDAHDDRGLRGLALDVARYDQRGCLSPQAVLVQGGQPEARRVIRRLGLVLAELQAELPAAPGGLEQEAARRRRLDLALLQAIARRTWEDHHGDGETYLVHRCAAPPVPLSPGGRVVAVLAVPDLRRALPGALGAAAGLVQGVAVVGDDPAAWQGVAGAFRVAAAGSLQTPPLTFRPDGLDPFARPGGVDEVQHPT
jgi:hypothetical protein